MSAILKFETELQSFPEGTPAVAYYEAWVDNQPHQRGNAGDALTFEVVDGSVGHVQAFDANGGKLGLEAVTVPYVTPVPVLVQLHIPVAVTLV